MIQRHIERIKERPRDERIAIAGTIAIGVMLALFVGWVIFFLRSLGDSAPPAPSSAVVAETL